MNTQAFDHRMVRKGYGDCDHHDHTVSGFVILKELLQLLNEIKRHQNHENHTQENMIQFSNHKEITLFF